MQALNKVSRPWMPLIVTVLLLYSLNWSGLHAVQAAHGPLSGFPTDPVGSAFKESFVDDTIDEDQWRVVRGWQYWDSWFSKSKVKLRHGKLELKSDAKDTYNDLLRVGGVKTKLFYSYGRISIRAKANPAYGMISAIYLYNEDADKEQGGHHEEIDIELSSKYPDRASLVTFHDDDWTNDEQQNDQHRGGIKKIHRISGLEDFDSHIFNTYVIDWQPGQITWFINGIQVRQLTQAVPDTPMKLHLDTYNTHEWSDFSDVGPEGAGVFQIDWVSYVPFEE